LKATPETASPSIGRKPHFNQQGQVAIGNKELDQESASTQGPEGTLLIGVTLDTTLTRARILYIKALQFPNRSHLCPREEADIYI